MLIRMKTLFLAVTISIVATTVFAGADLIVTPVLPGDITVSTSSSRPVRFLVRNLGPDQAKDVVLIITATGGVSTGACATGCLFPSGTLLVGGDYTTDPDQNLQFPDTPGDVVITASVTGSTPDPNPGNNSASTTVHVLADPDVAVSLLAPLKADLALPFPLTINLFNAAVVVAHDVDATVAFRPDVTVKTLPSGCTNPVAGSIVCHADALANGLVKFDVILFGPRSYGDGKVSFAATVTEREPDLYPPSNSFQASTSLYLTFYVTTTADAGAGSLRQAILDANAATGSLLVIAFRIGEPSSTLWKTIRVLSPLPAITASAVRIDGGTQAGFFGDANPDGPEIEISGGGTVDGDGLLVASCGSEVANLAIGGFLRNGISVTVPVNPDCSGYYATELHHLFLGSDPTGSSARPNARGMGISIANDLFARGGPTTIHDCVISGNTLSGIFDLSGSLTIANNRIGAKAHADEPLPNGASGVFIGTGGSGSVVGPVTFQPIFGTPTSVLDGNVIAFNGETGVGVATDAKNVEIRDNRIWSNRLLGIDIGLNGPTASVPADFGVTVTSPVLTMARFDSAQNKTIVEGDLPDAPTSGSVFDGPIFTANIYANDAADPSGYGEGQRPLGAVSGDAAGHFHFEAAGDLTGQWITATNTRSRTNDIEGETFRRQTSEFSRGVAVQ